MSQPDTDHGQMEDDPLWYKDAIIYELHVRAFADSNGDGIGDLQGLIDKLDYLQDLGVTAAWLLPFYPSPLRDDGYDISDYTSVNPSYGTLRDFRKFLRAAHDRGIRVITELVVNHTSSEHDWFQRARRAPPGSKLRDYYVWSDSPDRYGEARIIFKDFENSNWTWDPVAKAYYWHRFYSHQPDLNFANPEVQKSVFKALDFWMEMGVDGMRLDAVPYLYEREGTNCENLPETHGFLKRLRAHIDGKYRDRMLLAEANQWPEDAAEYFGAGDECHMNFHFPLMPRMFMALQLETSFPIVDIMTQTPKIADVCQWALFLRNHDELTLEMVTDEDRDYMYRVYADDPQARINLGIRRRLAPLLKSRQKLQLMNALLFSMPGTPVLYYGDEIGMGDNIYLGDRNGVRTPMQWSGDRNAGFSRGNPQRLYLPVIIDPEYHYESINVEAQQNNTSSLLWWTKRLIGLRKDYKVFGRGSIDFLSADNPKVLAFVRSLEDQHVLVVANLSRFSQGAELELEQFEGRIPIELFGKSHFPAIGKAPYFLSLAPHSFFWFALEPEREPIDVSASSKPLRVREWEGVFRGSARNDLERALPGYVRSRRWFRGKARGVKAMRLADVIPLGSLAPSCFLSLVQVEYLDDTTEDYVLPLAIVEGIEAAHIEADQGSAVLARLQRIGSDGTGDGGALLCDAIYSKDLPPALLGLFRSRRTLKGQRVQLGAQPLRAFRNRARSATDLTPWVLAAEQSNSSIGYGEALILKLYRRLEEGVNPDVEVTRYLTERAEFPHVPHVAGVLELTNGRREASALGILQEYVPNQGDAWRFTLDALGQYFERATPHLSGGEPAPRLGTPLLERTRQAAPPAFDDLVGPYITQIRLLGRRTAQLHLALSKETEDPAFTPEPFSTLHQRSLYQSARTLARQTLQSLRKGLREFDDVLREDAQALLAEEAAIDGLLRRILARRIETERIRTHGDLHLGQVLFLGDDFCFIDFEGEPARSIEQRRYKRSPLRDVAGMLRSFHYAGVSALRRGSLRAEDIPALTPWADAWIEWVSAAFLSAYLGEAEGARFLPPDPTDLATLLDFYLIEKCLYELGYELNNRRDWVAIPLDGLRGILGAEVKV